MFSFYLLSLITRKSWATSRAPASREFLEDLPELSPVCSSHKTMAQSDNNARVKPINRYRIFPSDPIKRPKHLL